MLSPRVRGLVIERLPVAWGFHLCGTSDRWIFPSVALTPKQGIGPALSGRWGWFGDAEPGLGVDCLRQTTACC